MWGFSALLVKRKDRVQASLFFIFPSFSRHSLSSRKAMEEGLSLFPNQNKGCINSQFLQKLGCLKPYWNQARLSSLVSKQVGSSEDLEEKDQ